jgi:hypothetical protein
VVSTPTKIDLHEGSTLSPYLFALVMDKATKDHKGISLVYVFFADNVVLVDKSRVGVNWKLELW